MKKTLLTFAAAIVATTAAVSQIQVGKTGKVTNTQAQGEPEGYEYVPIVREDVKWGYGWGIAGVKWQTGSYFLQMKGDTIINEKTYKKCYRYNAWNLEEDATAKITAFVREENKRVYAIRTIGISGSARSYDNTEELIYDFNVGVGDRMDTYYMWMPISKIEYVNIQGALRKAFYAKMGDVEQVYAIEGIGMIDFYPTSQGDLLEPMWEKAACLECCNNWLNYVGVLPLDVDLAVFEYERGVEMDAVAEVAADRKTLSVRQGDGWVEADLDGDCYRRATLADAQGRTVRSVEIAQGDAVATIPTTGLVPGVYLFSLHAATGATTTQKVSIAD